jgi:hypothetical protein
VERAHDGPHEGRLAGTQRPAEPDDVARPQRTREYARKGIESGLAVEDVIRSSQNGDWCFCV